MRSPSCGSSFGSCGASAAPQRHDDSARGWFLAAVCASVAAYGVSMFFFDATSFIQVTFLFFILLGLGSAGYRLGGYESAPAPRTARRRSRTASPILAGS